MAVVHSHSVENDPRSNPPSSRHTTPLSQPPVSPWDKYSPQHQRQQQEQHEQQQQQQDPLQRVDFWRPAFQRARNSIADTMSRNDMLATVSSFVDDLPPFYTSAAWYHVREQRRDGGIANLDSLAAYFTQLDKTASTATHVPAVWTSKTSRKNRPATDTSPLDASCLEFTPSRPRIANLLQVDQRSPEADDERPVDCAATCSPP